MDFSSTPQNEAILKLPNNRQLHYSSAGDLNSTTVVIFFSGYLSIGIAHDSSIPKPLVNIHPHWIAPTIPGNGPSSSTPKGTPYHLNLCSTITALLETLHPSDNSRGNAIEKLYIGGGSYGTVPAQMLYGAPYELFPYGRRIAGLILAAPFSPFKYHKDYTRDMTWTNWISVGPPSQWIPFRLVPRLLSTAIAARCKDLEGVKKLFDTLLFSKMSGEEKARFEAHALEKRGVPADVLKTEMANGALRCTENWDGFLEGPDVLHSDWGFDPAALDDEHSKPVLVVQSEADELGEGMGRWLVDSYKKARLEKISGGHIAALYCMDEIWIDLLSME